MSPVELVKKLALLPFLFSKQPKSSVELMCRSPVVFQWKKRVCDPGKGINYTLIMRFKFKWIAPGYVKQLQIRWSWLQPFPVFPRNFHLISYRKHK